MTINDVLRNDLCVGCGLCQTIFGQEKVLVKYDEKGFLRPSVLRSLTESEEVIFTESCPGINIRHLNTIGHDTFLGPFREIKVGYASDDKIRYNGSSGGVITGLATFLLSEGKVDYILHIGPSNKEPSRSVTKISSTKQDLIDNSGSRYAPSATLLELKEILDRDNLNSLAVIGKPCDIVGVRNFMKNNYDAKRKIKYLISFMCAGVPSINGTLNIVKKFGLKEEEVKELKYRGEGWPGYFKVKDIMSKEHKMSYNDSWGNELNRHLQFRCKICPDGTGEFADITCADAWESSDEGYPSFEERPGLSLIITRTDNGEQLLNEAVTKNHIIISSTGVGVGDVKKMQPYQLKRKQNLIARLFALKLLKRKTHNYNRKTLLRASMNENPLRLGKNFLGTLKRAKN